MEQNMTQPSLPIIPVHTYRGNPPTEIKEIAYIVTGYGSRLNIELLRYDDADHTRYILSIRKFVKGKGAGEQGMYYPVKQGITLAEEGFDALKLALNTAIDFVETHNRKLPISAPNNKELPSVPVYSSRVIACGPKMLYPIGTDKTPEPVTKPPEASVWPEGLSRPEPVGTLNAFPKEAGR